MKNKITDAYLQNLPACAAEFIKLVIKKMRYRKKVRSDVMAELAAHFEDELRDCKNDEEKEQKAQKLIERFGDAKLLGILLRRAKKRCRPLWRTIAARTFQTVGILIACFLPYCIYISLGQPSIRVNYIEETNRITRPSADESLNAAHLYQKAIDNYKEPPKIKCSETEPEVLLRDAIKDKTCIAELNENELAALKQWISDNTDAIESFRQATVKPYCWWQRTAKDNVAMSVLMPELGTIRNLVKITVWDAKLKAYNGDTEVAFGDLFACYRAGIHFKSSGTLVEQLVGISIQALARRAALIILKEQSIDNQLLTKVQAEFEKLINSDNYIIRYDLERLCWKDFIQRCYTDDGKGSGHMIPREIKKLMQLIEGGEIKNSSTELFLNYIVYLGMAICGTNRRQMTNEFEKICVVAGEWAHKTPWQLKQENIDFEMGFDKSAFKRLRLWPVAMLLPAFGKVNQIAYRGKTEDQALLGVLAIIRYKQDKGQYPQGLDELKQAGYIKEVPTDPFSDKPLVYKKTDDNFILYSVGLNFKDDGGQIVRDEKGRIKLWADEGDAVFWPVEK